MIFKNSTIDPNRLYWIDGIRSFACLCVLLIHSPLPSSNKSEVMTYLVGAGASVLFFMISGALVLYKPKPFLPFIKQRLLRIALPMLLWTVVALIIMCLNGEVKWSELPTKFMLMPFTPQFGTYWFIYVIFGIYLLTPMIATWLERCTRRDLEVVLAISAVAMIVPILSLVHKRFGQAMTYGNGSLYYFGGYLWVAMIGYYLRRYVNITRFKWWYIAVLAAILLLPLLLVECGVPIKTVLSRNSLNILLLTSTYFVVIKHLHFSPTMKRIVYDFAQHSFGIYLVHQIINKFLLYPIITPLNLHNGLSITLVFVLNLILSYSIVHLLSKLSYSKYFVGL